MRHFTENILKIEIYYDAINMRNLEQKQIFENLFKTIENQRMCSENIFKNEIELNTQNDAIIMMCERNFDMKQAEFFEFAKF